MACMGALSQTRAVLTLSEACERNKGPILEVLRTEFAASRSVLEVGSGTGQHAVHFAAHLPHLAWQPSEVEEQLAPLAERIRLEGTSNLRAPIALDAREHPWRVAPVDAVFSANTLHIIAWSAVRAFVRGVAGALTAPGVVCRSEEHTSELQSRRDLVCRLLLEKKKKRACCVWIPLVGGEFERRSR